MQRSPVESLRLKTPHKIPDLLQDLSKISFSSTKIKTSSQELSSLFPNSSSFPLLQAQKGERKALSSLKIGAVFSGGPAAGGHNVLAGLFDTNPNGKLFGFLNGPNGIVTCSYKELSRQDIDVYRNLGGFDLLGSGRTKIETEEQMQAALNTCNTLALDGLVIIGGDDSNTNAAILAEFFLQNGCRTKVIGVPKTIDGDLQNPYVPISFGFDTACRVYSELIGNICKDASSSKKYTHFIKLMGRSASHVTLECALATQPNYTFIAEEVYEKKKGLQEIVSDLCDVIAKRSLEGKNYGVVLVPEGLIEFIPEIASLIQELNTALAKKESSNFAIDDLSDSSKKCFNSLPETIQKQLLLQRDPHGNVQVSLIETEKLLAELVDKELKKRKNEGKFLGSFSFLTHFFGYEGRCAIPSDFDASYCYILGIGASLLLHFGATGYMAFVKNMHLPLKEWEVGGVPLTSLIHLELRKGKQKPVIQKALVSCKGFDFKYFLKNKDIWAVNDDYLSPGPMQFSETLFLPKTVSLKLSQQGEDL